jgi:hypothetical protein
MVGVRSLVGIFMDISYPLNKHTLEISGRA